MKFSKLVLDFLGTDDVTDELLDKKLGELLGSQASDKTELDGLKTKNSELATQVAELEKIKPMATVGEAYLKQLREDVEAKYKLLRGEDAKQEMLSVIQSAGVDQAKALQVEYNQELEEKIPGICSECGKQAKLIRKSSKQIDQDKAANVDASDYQVGNCS